MLMVLQAFFRISNSFGAMQMSILVSEFENRPIFHLGKG